MIRQDLWFIEERATAFASLLLTKNKDVVVRAQAGTDMAVDLLVEILKHGRSALRFFGVQLVADLDLPDIPEVDERVLLHLGRNSSEASLPICLFVIGVRKPEGIYSWVAEPVIDGSQALLRRDEKHDWRSLDDAAVVRLIRQVNDWYDARQGELSPKGQNRHAKDRP